MNRDAFWSIICDRAIMDRKGFLDCWSGTGNFLVIEETNAEIARFRALSGKRFKESIDSDREGVRLALLSAESWYVGVEGAQLGRERRHAASMYRRVHALRAKVFGRTQLEVMVENCVGVPIEEVHNLIKSGLPPVDFLATLTNQ